MEIAARAPRRSRIEFRFRRSAQDATAQAQPVQEREEKGEEEEAFSDADESLLDRERKDRTVMGRAHGVFHRQAAPSKVLTVVVDVVATVDSTGKLLGLATSTPVPVDAQVVPSVVLPSVPPVPPFPSDLTVPAYPWPSGVPPAVGLSTALSSPLPSSSQVSGASSVVSSAFPVTSLANFSSTTPSRSLIRISRFHLTVRRRYTVIIYIIGA